MLVMKFGGNISASTLNKFKKTVKLRYRKFIRKNELTKVYKIKCSSANTELRRVKNWKLKENETTTNHNRSLGAGGNHT